MNENHSTMNGKYSSMNNEQKIREIPGEVFWEQADFSRLTTVFGNSKIGDYRLEHV
jgi:hypothetical protein